MKRHKGRVVDRKKKPVSAISAACPEGRKSKHGESVDRERLRGGESRSGESPSLPVKRNKHREYVGVWKLGGQRRTCQCSGVCSVYNLGVRNVLCR